MKQTDFARARAYALERLSTELSPLLCYHSLSHTRDGVVPAVERFGVWHGVDQESMLLLRTAAWYHDIGFVEQRVDHEVAGVRIAGTVLPGFGYNRSQIAAIGGMIMATKLPQTPQTMLEQLLADADLDGLGRSNFMERNRDLRLELEAFGFQTTDEAWLSDQLDFLKSHQYWTAAARTLRDAGKQRNLAMLKQQLDQHRAYQARHGSSIPLYRDE